MLPLLGLLVKLLEKLMPIEEPAIERPMYLNDSLEEVPDAATEAVRNETIRLYDISVDVITTGLNIHRQVFHSTKKAKHVIKQSTEIIDKDIDDLYERKIKALYGAIVEFIISTRGGYARGALKEELNALRGAGQHVVEAVKGVKHLRKNLIRFLKSDNLYIIKEYNKLRFLIIRVLREIEASRESGPHDVQVMPLQLDPLKLEIEGKINKITSGLDKSIRKNHLDVNMATSLMNDISYCKDVCWDLIEAALILFSTSNRVDQNAEQSISLDEHEIAEIIESPQGETNP
jgi:phosphate:Na+ symporter